ncbi:hypothetical protein VD0002_g10263 [Verticillium dahliae]|uniref:Uncharacterized protein n=1 Tax=Verticillium dahliae TaxID=27337 RepID=A0AA44WJR2_VERDA|nr:hypothetical protein BJF96_g4696 [Verticillium dahliae]PNH36862.1 hypothetical protein VD0004_g9903 [Verticillium dahliae]PNH41103.1 hypothetical protein VD0003_g10014 [Verticillium dahliae]PNH51115.1 hypothetical protein VD0002_g10263 [Verticillium dahliae]PNH60140.1 hypothetical protein VD0001_g9889 [Verticillium dahliae]
MSHIFLYFFCKPHPAVPPGAGPAEDAVRHGAATGQSLTKMSTSR